MTAEKNRKPYTGPENDVIVTALHHVPVIRKLAGIPEAAAVEKLVEAYGQVLTDLKRLLDSLTVKKTDPAVIEEIARTIPFHTRMLTKEDMARFVQQAQMVVSPAMLEAPKEEVALEPDKITLKKQHDRGALTQMAVNRLSGLQIEDRNMIARAIVDVVIAARAMEA